MQISSELVLVLVLLMVCCLQAAPFKRIKRHQPTQVRAHLSDGSNIRAEDFVGKAGIVDDITDDEVNNLLPEFVPISRSKRSAVFLLSATMRLCGEHNGLCRRVEVDDGRTRAVLRLSDF